MESGPPTIRVTGVTGELAARIEAAGHEALAQLGEAGPGSPVMICVDGLPGGDFSWYGFEPAGDDGRTFALYCSREAFLEAEPLTSALSTGPEIWEQRPAPRFEGDSASRPFAADSAARFLHHHFLFAGDLLGRRVNMATIPPGRGEAFQAGWSVTVDGRLARWGLPGFSLFWRRGIFSRLFAGSAILLPDHWRVFQSLWDGEINTQEAVLKVIRRLPRL